MTEISLLNTDILKELAAFEAPLCLTLTMPCIKSGDQQQQNAIRFKNLLQDATKKLDKSTIFYRRWSRFWMRLISGPIFKAGLSSV